jgi:hypothetical protein
VTPGLHAKDPGMAPPSPGPQCVIAPPDYVRSRRRSDTIRLMRARKLQVTNGRLVLDEPTNLPDGAEVEVVVVDDELSAEGQVALHASLDRALDDSEAGRGTDAWEYLKQYRARREARPA